MCCTFYITEEEALDTSGTPAPVTNTTDEPTTMKYTSSTIGILTPLCFQISDNKSVIHWLN